MSGKSKNSSNKTRAAGNPGSPAEGPGRGGGKPGSPAAGPGRGGGKPGSPAAGPSHGGGKPGRKPAAHKTTAPRSRRKVPPGLGATRLRNSVNVILNDESDRIAHALVNKTIAGNMSGARLLVELSGARHAPAKPEDKAEDKDGGPGLVELMMSRGEWVEMAEFDKNPPFPGESLEAYSRRNKYYLPPPSKPDF